MRKRLPILILLLLALHPLTALPLSLSGDISVSRAGSLVDTFNNPAALPFRSAGEGNFLFAAAYSDDADANTYSEKLGLFQSSQTSFLLSFGGRNAMFTLGLGHDLENRNLNGDVLTYDLYFRMHFQLDVAYNFGPFSFGARLQGGSSLIRSGRRIDSLYDFATNLLFAEFYENPGSEYFTMGLGLMWYDEWFTLGACCDNVLFTEDGDVVFRFERMTDSLSLGASLHLPRYRSDGELRFLRPVLNLQAGNVSSATDSYLMASLEARFQLLPDTNLSFLGGIVSYRNAQESYFTTTDNHQLYSFTVEAGPWAFEARLVLPVSYLRGSSTTAPSFTISMRLNPR